MLGNAKVCLGIVLLVGLGGSAALANTTVYNNFGPGQGGFDFDLEMGWVTFGWSVSYANGAHQAQTFTAGASGPLADIYIPLGAIPDMDPRDDITVRLATDNGGDPQEADVLESWQLSNIQMLNGSWFAPFDLASQTHPQLTAGQSYWVWLVPGDFAAVDWPMNPAGYGVTTTRDQYIETYYIYGEWTGRAADEAGALRVDVVPEPSVLATVVLGLVSFARRR